MVTANILQRLLLVQYEKSLGSAFTIEVGEKQFLISARHVFEEIKMETDVIKVFKDNSWKSITVTPIFCDDHRIDIIAFGLENDLSVKLPISVEEKGATLSQDVYFLGYPYGMKHEINTSDGFPLPFVKKGIISALNSPVLWFDGHNNPGFSGGPIVINKAGNNLQIISVISAYRKHNGSDENSGIFCGYSIDYIVNAIKKYLSE